MPKSGCVGGLLTHESQIPRKRQHAGGAAGRMLGPAGCLCLILPRSSHKRPAHDFLRYTQASNDMTAPKI